MARDVKTSFPESGGSTVHLAVYVPSTKNISDDIGKMAHKKRVLEVVKFLQKTYHGSTRYKAMGNFYSKKLGRDVDEEVTRVETYTTPKDYQNNIKELKKFLNRKKIDWSQEEIGFEFEEELHFV